MRRTLCALAFAVLAQATARAAEPPLIEAATVCPMFGPNRACLTTPMIPFRIPAHDDDHDVDESERPDYPDPKLFDIRGRLNGAPPQAFRLQVVRHKGAEVTPFPPSIPYLGQSPAGNIIILTTKGQLEILSRGFAVETYGHDYIDARTWKFLNLKIITAPGDLVVTSPANILIWDNDRGLCISALFQKRERLRLVPGGCRARPGAPPAFGSPAYRRMLFQEIARFPRELRRQAYARYAAWRTGLKADDILELNWPSPKEEDEDLFSEPYPMPLARLKELYPNEVNDEMEYAGPISDHYGGAGTGISIHRIRGTHILFVSIVHDDC